MTVPEYYTKFINQNVNLNETPKVCCPFHQEDTPSFSYHQETGRWRCFGSCKTGGDVIDMHRVNYKLGSRKEAEKSLLSVLGIKESKNTEFSTVTQPVILNEDEIELNRIYHLCKMYADRPERWLDMDYAMSVYPVDVMRLKELLSKWGIKYK